MSDSLQLACKYKTYTKYTKKKMEINKFELSKTSRKVKTYLPCFLILLKFTSNT